MKFIAIDLETANSCQSSKAKYLAKHLIVCGGLQADRIARKEGVKLREKVVGFRGDYYELNDHPHHTTFFTATP